MLIQVKRFFAVLGICVFAALSAVLASCATQPGGDDSSPLAIQPAVDVPGSQGGQWFRYLPRAYGVGDFWQALDADGTVNGYPQPQGDTTVVYGFQKAGDVVEQFNVTGLVEPGRYVYPVTQQGDFYLRLQQMRNGSVVQYVFDDPRYNADRNLVVGPDGHRYLACTLFAREYRKICTSWIQGQQGDENDLTSQGDHIIRITAASATVALPTLRGTPSAIYNGVLKPVARDLGSFKIFDGNLVPGTTTDIAVVGLDSAKAEIDRLNTADSSFGSTDSQGRANFLVKMSVGGLISRSDVDTSQALRISAPLITVLNPGESSVLRVLGDFAPPGGGVRQRLEVTSFCTFTSSNPSLLSFSGSRMTAGNTGGVVQVTVSYGAQSRTVDVVIANTATNPAPGGGGSTGTGSGGVQVYTIVGGSPVGVVGDIETYSLVGDFGPVVWSFSGVGCDIDRNGVVRYLSAGQGIISAVRNGIVTTKSIVTVPPGSRLTITANITGPVSGGAVVQLAPNASGTFTWTSSDSSLATVDSNGRVTTVYGKSGVVDIICRDGSRAGCREIEVWPLNGISSFKATPFWLDSDLSSRLGFGSGIQFISDVTGWRSNPLNTTTTSIPGPGGTLVAYRVLVTRLPSVFTVGRLVYSNWFLGTNFVPDSRDPVSPEYPDNNSGGKTWATTVIRTPQP